MNRVTYSLADPSGDPIHGATVTAKLSAPIIVAQVVAAMAVTDVSDHDGQGFLDLMPNGTTGTTYTFEILLPGTVRPLVYRGIVVPDVATTTLSALLGWGGAVAGALTFDGATLLVGGVPLVFT